ncbi:Uncharacterised protein [Vibrio cholerae]|nr:Uncharacterised protein [Vibrio cholerae]CSB51382.1 Uncharacterised protein [Vibrio cholerae]
MMCKIRISRILRCNKGRVLRRAVELNKAFGCVWRCLSCIDCG